MRIARYEHGGRVHHGRLDDDDGLHRLKGSPFDVLDETGDIDQLAEVRLLAPVDPPRVFGVGLNYLSHAREAGQAAPEPPMLFMKPPSAIIGPEAPIVYPSEGQEVHFEGELAVIIGRRTRRIPEAEALSAVLGYSCANDVSERTIQFAEMRQGCLLIGKGFDSFCPLGPFIATDLDPTNLDLVTRVNGVERQRINTSDLIYPVARLVSYLSQAITLEPGDVIITGTPAGVGPTVPGDTIEVEIGGIGLLRNAVEAEA